MLICHYIFIKPSFNFIPDDGERKGSFFFDGGILAGFPSPAGDFKENRISLDTELVGDTEVSQYLTDKQLLPNVGDGLTLAGDDGKLIGLEKGSFEHIQTVKRRWYNYASSNVALLLHYETW